MIELVLKLYHAHPFIWALAWVYMMACLYDIQRGQWAMATIWGCYGVANFAWLTRY